MLGKSGEGKISEFLIQERGTCRTICLVAIGVRSCIYTGAPTGLNHQRE